MNKFIFFVLLFLYVSAKDYSDFLYGGIIDGSNCTFQSVNASVDNCKAVPLNNEDYKCCFVESGNEKECWGVKKKDVKDFVKDSDNVSIDCSSNYLSKALIFLLSLLF